jgi:indole-3-glycerol phosphate synthase
MSTFLQNILDAKRHRIEESKSQISLSELKERNFVVSGHRRDFKSALIASSKINVIAEFKRASPSKGVINDELDPASVAKQYEKGGAKAISVLTEEDFFRGSLDDLAAVSLPILRKDFVIDEYQIYESAAAGADAILLIIAALDRETLTRFQALANELKLDAIVEVHDLPELETAIDIGAKIIGVNNRNLKTFDVSLDVSRELIKLAPDDVVVITESGLKTREEILELNQLGYKGFLIGETLMRSGDAEAELRNLMGND